jgi:hypothetical protein
MWLWDMKWRRRREVRENPRRGRSFDEEWLKTSFRGKCTASLMYNGYVKSAVSRQVYQKDLDALVGRQ